MKNFIFALLAALSSFSVSAQMPIPYFQNFDDLPNSSTPSEIDIIDADACILQGPQPPMDVWIIGQKSSQGDSAMFVRSTYTDTSCVSSDWLIIGPFTGITNLTEWKWECSAFYADESYVVYASAGNLPSDFMQAGPIASFTKLEAFQVFYMDSVSLSSFAGQDIYVAYQYISRNKVGFSIDNISIANDTTIGTNELVTANAVLVYPNPNNGAFSVKTTEVVEYIQVVDVLGKVIVQKMPQSNNENIDLSAYPSGIYFVQLRDKNTTKTVQIQKQ